MKKTITLLAVMVAVVALAGCKLSRTPIDAETFAAKAAAAGYTVTDATQELNQADTVACLFAAKGTEEDGYKIEFRVLSSVEQASAMHRVNRLYMEAQKGSRYSQSDVSAGNYSSYKLTSNQWYHVSSRTENTFVYVVASDEYKDEIAAFLREIGY